MITTAAETGMDSARIVTIAPNVLAESLSYEEYRTLIADLYANGEATGGSRSESMLHYTKLNQVRMKRLDKTTRLLPETESFLQNPDGEFVWLVITEGWCGDAAQILPVLNKMADSAEGVSIRFILRDEHLDVIDQFLTDGGRSIPIVLVLDPKTNRVLGNWGPRPAIMQALAMETKQTIATIEDPEERKTLNESVKIEAQRWYTSDRTASIQREFVSALSKLTK
ncbi:MAG: thioredoxin family protein [Rhodothermales bacterium]|nr:thioredoxin family protein [Rhodothermales bacterium]